MTFWQQGRKTRLLTDIWSGVASFNATAQAQAEEQPLVIGAARLHGLVYEPVQAVNLYQQPSAWALWACKLQMRLPELGQLSPAQYLSIPSITLAANTAFAHSTAPKFALPSQLQASGPALTLQPL